ncbi:hypothetical protein PFMG_03497 [Plasmodium falciparum IGH-CR14]|uniref:Uncharacterized protein n=1 Tax=Plasmodium falciparum IGH-CR14 TaxID=580059 RepID=A0A0L1ICF4_PLAFA|nr:hypothetical protein PFMG_03497 [Plasmodium falciparum IGH-CR14]
MDEGINKKLRNKFQILVLCGVNEEIYKVKDASERIGQFKFTRKLVCNIIITPSYEYKDDTGQNYIEDISSFDIYSECVYDEIVVSYIYSYYKPKYETFIGIVLRNY